MPLNARQLAALDSLTWLFDNSDSARRSGRTLALAVAAIRSACRSPGISVRIFDHAMPGRDGLNYMMRTISDFVESDERLRPHFTSTRDTFVLTLPRPIDWLPEADATEHLLPMAARARVAGRRAGQRLRDMIPSEDPEPAYTFDVASESQLQEEVIRAFGLPNAPVRIPEPEPEPEPLSKWDRLLAED